MKEPQKSQQEETRTQPLGIYSIPLPLVIILLCRPGLHLRGQAHCWLICMQPQGVPEHRSRGNPYYSLIWGHSVSCRVHLVSIFIVHYPLFFFYCPLFCVFCTCLCQFRDTLLSLQCIQPAGGVDSLHSFSAPHLQFIGALSLKGLSDASFNRLWVLACDVFKPLMSTNTLHVSP